MAYEYDNFTELLRVPWTNDGRNFRYFKTKQARENYMNGRAHKRYSKVYTTKLGEPIRIDDTQDNVLAKYNYVRFRNGSTGSDIIYGFITDISWLSMASCMVHYEIDWWTTYQFRMEFGGGYIEREHTKDDDPTDLPEPISVTDYAYVQKKTIGGSGEYTTFLFTGKTAPTFLGEPSKCDGKWTGLYIYALGESLGTTANPFDLATELNKLADGNVIYAVDVPNEFFTLTSTTYDLNNGDTYEYVVNWNFKNLDITVDRPDAFGTYTPRNAKCYRYPFMGVTASNMQGAVRNYKWERFQNHNQATFNMRGSMGTSPNAVSIPKGYRGSGGSIESVHMQLGVPANISSDYFQGWMSRNAVGIATQVFGTVAAGATGNIAGFAAGTASLANQAYVAQHTANPVNIGENSMKTLLRSGLLNFSYWVFRVTEDQCVANDNFFQKYGYTAQRVGTPEFNNRKNWYYCKAQEMDISGNCPMAARDHMKDALARGCTFWHDDGMGNYNRDNP